MSAELVACYKPLFQAVWLKDFVSKPYFLVSILDLIKIFNDNSSVVYYSKDNKIFNNLKYIVFNISG